jgi:predicted RNA-binding protein with PUA-like domain
MEPILLNRGRARCNSNSPPPLLNNQRLFMEKDFLSKKLDHYGISELLSSSSSDESSSSSEQCESKSNRNSQEWEKVKLKCVLYFELNILINEAINLFTKKILKIRKTYQLRKMLSCRFYRSF